MKKKFNLTFKQDIEFEGDKFIAGKSYAFDMEQYKFDRLTRRGCIYAAKDAELSNVKEEVKVEPKKPEPKKEEKKVEPKKELDNVDNKKIKDSKQAKVQAKSADTK